MKRSIFVAVGIYLFSCAANAALFKLEYLGLSNGVTSSFCASYTYDCPDTVSLALTFDTTTYGSLSTPSFWSNTADEGRLSEFRASGMSIASLILRADDRILLNDATGLAFSVRADGRAGTSTSGCNCIVSIDGAGGVPSLGWIAYEHIFLWPMISDLGDDPVATALLSGLGSTPWHAEAFFSGEWGRLGSLSTPGNFVITPVPVPPAVWLFGSALGLMGVMQRKISA